MAKIKKYTKEFLEPLVKQTTSISMMIKQMGLKPNGGNYRLIQQRIRQHEINIDHFNGQSWSKGLCKDTSESITKGAIKRRTPDNEVFCINSKYTTRLKKRFLDLGFENKCNICGIEDWMGKPITLHIDHINGISNDNRIDNLQILCPNCHQQTETWGNKNGSVEKLVNSVDLESAAQA